VPAREHGFAPGASATGRMIAHLVRTGQAEPVAFHYGRVKPRRKFDRYAKRWRCGDRGRRPGQMVQVDHLSDTIDAGFAVKESEAVCPVSKLCCMRAYSRANAAATPIGRIRLSDSERPCRRIMNTSAKARLPPEKSHMY